MKRLITLSIILLSCVMSYAQSDSLEIKLWVGKPFRDFLYYSGEKLNEPVLQWIGSGRTIKTVHKNQPVEFYVEAETTWKKYSEQPDMKIKQQVLFIEREKDFLLQELFLSWGFVEPISFNGFVTHLKKLSDKDSLKITKGYDKVTQCSIYTIDLISF